MTTKKQSKVCQRQFYRIIEISPSKNFNPEEPYELDSSCVTNDKTNKKPNKNAYTGILAQSLETLQLEKVCKATLHRNFSFTFNTPLSNACLGYTDVLINVAINDYSLRKELYKNGITICGQKYVRYKRSASSAKEGKCLFIMEKLFDVMNTWSACGIKKTSVTDLTSWEAYRALTLTGIESLFSLPKCSILILKDLTNTFSSDNLVVTNVKNTSKVCVRTQDNLSPEEKEKYKISNVIWDGESLIDESVFEAPDFPEEYRNKSMLLLRNKFFKSCAFRTRLQQWFSDNNVTEIKQLADYSYTSARKIEDIKLVITESSFKYLKFYPIPKEPDSSTPRNPYKSWRSEVEKAYKDWCKSIETHKLVMGIVKTDKPPKYMNGKMVLSSYQLLNTLGLADYDDKNETKDLLQPSIDYINGLKKNPAYMQHFLDNFSSEEENAENNESFEAEYHLYQYHMMKQLLKSCPDISNTRYYQDFKHHVVSKFRRQLSEGKFLIEGTYATLFGNPAEFLYATIKHNKKNYYPGDVLTMDNQELSVIQNNEVYCTRFNGTSKPEALCCVRFPHYTMGNLLYTTNNTSYEFYKTYFSLSDNIICVNAINSDIMVRLNGADYDSDTVLVTNNPIIVAATKRQTALGCFKVPLNGISLAKKSRKTEETDLSTELALVDKKISDNYIGEITNISQIFNSIFWDRYPIQKMQDENFETVWNSEASGLYQDIALLTIMSNIEIDKSKRPYRCNTAYILKELKKDRIMYSYDNGYFYNMPSFLSDILSSGKTVDTSAGDFRIYSFRSVLEDLQKSTPDLSRTGFVNCTKLTILDKVSDIAKITYCQGYHFILSFSLPDASQEDCIEYTYEFIHKLISHDNTNNGVAFFCLHENSHKFHAHILYCDARCMSSKERKATLLAIKSTLYQETSIEHNVAIEYGKEILSLSKPLAIKLPRVIIHLISQAIRDTQLRFTKSTIADDFSDISVITKINNINISGKEEVTAVAYIRATNYNDDYPKNANGAFSPNDIQSFFSESSLSHQIIVELECTSKSRKLYKAKIANVYSSKDKTIIVQFAQNLDSQCTMAKISSIIKSKKYEDNSRITSTTRVSLCDLINKPNSLNSNLAGQVNRILQIVAQSNDELKKIYSRKNVSHNAETQIIANCFFEVAKELSVKKYIHHTLYRILQIIDSTEDTSANKNIQAENYKKDYRALLFAAIILEPEGTLLHLIHQKSANIPIHSLSMDENNGTIEIYGHKYTYSILKP